MALKVLRTKSREIGSYEANLMIRRIGNKAAVYLNYLLHFLIYIYHLFNSVLTQLDYSLPSFLFVCDEFHYKELRSIT